MLGLFQQFRVEADIHGLGITAAPLGFHPLQVIGPDSDVQLLFPFVNESGKAPGRTIRVKRL